MAARNERTSRGDAAAGAADQSSRGDARVRPSAQVVYSAGATTYNVELDIILPPEMPHRDAHDVGQALQDRLEADEEVSRAFVHLDWEASHDVEHGGRPSIAKRPRTPSVDAAAPLLVKKGT